MKSKNSRRTIALFAAAAILLVSSGVMGTRAALTVYSPFHYLAFNTDNQDVVVCENGTEASTLLQSMSGKVVPGKEVKEELSAKNTSDANQFVRMVVRKYWMDAEGNKITDLEEVDGKYPELDKINLAFVGSGKWMINSQETTPERVVYYYSDVVAPGRPTDKLTTTLTIDGRVAEAQGASEPDADGVITYTYEYDGMKIGIEAEAQSIQTHNAQDAVKSIWGVQNVTATETSLSVQ